MILKTGETILTQMSEEKQGREHWYVHLGRWLTMASQFQEMTHNLIKTKGVCRK